MWKWLFIVVVVGLVATAAFAHWRYRQARSEAEQAMVDIAARAAGPGTTFDAAMVAGLPEVARRYFTHAIADGTPLNTTVQLEMRGTFLLGDKARLQSFAMQARQILSPPDEFVWMPTMRSGLLEVTGSDALVGGEAWTRFWINQLVPVVDLSTSPDLRRSALSRSAMEAIWAPASLLPGNGVRWEQTGPDTARLVFSTGIEPVDLTLDATGRVLEVVTMRWSDANDDKTFRLQPFGGTMEAEATFDGFTIPSAIKVGNHYGTDLYLPFFQAEITGARFL